MHLGTNSASNTQAVHQHGPKGVTEKNPSLRTVKQQFCLHWHISLSPGQRIHTVMNHSICTHVHSSAISATPCPWETHSSLNQSSILFTAKKVVLQTARCPVSYMARESYLHIYNFTWFCHWKDRNSLTYLCYDSLIFLFNHIPLKLTLLFISVNFHFVFDLVSTPYDILPLASHY